mmetsp:Transcript_34230/g.73113  ORF Transcript_34230/g.73113 Transcript_34230/m.73113 type:complete len:100 (-) Transcript_34230:110-409(-)
MAEFFLQGDREKELEIPVSAFMDREKTTVVRCQMGFISVLVKPLYDEWRKLLGTDMQPAVDALNDNLNGWETEGTGMCDDWDIPGNWRSLPEIQSEPGR